MSIFKIFMKLFLTGIISILISFGLVLYTSYPIDLKGRIFHIIAKILFVIACVVTAINFFGIIWTA